MCSHTTFFLSTHPCVRSLFPGGTCQSQEETPQRMCDAHLLQLGFNMGTGTVLVFGALRHTAYLCHSVVGTHRFIVISLSSFFLHFKLRFVLLFSIFFPLCHIVTGPNMAVRATCTSSPLPPPPPPPPLPQVHAHCISKL